MAQITTIATAAADVKVNSGPGAISHFCKAFSPTTLSATVTNGDAVVVATLPANSKIIGGAWRVIGTSAVTGIVHLQTTEPTGNTIPLTPTSGAPASPSVALVTAMTLPHHGVSTGVLTATSTRTLDIAVASGTLSVTNGLIYVVDCYFIPYP